MIKSMTGFGAATSQGRDFSVHAQILSVNRPHLDIDVSFGAKDCAFLLPDMRDLVREHVKRGRVQVTLSVDTAGDARRILFNESLARTLLSRLRAWEKASFGSQSITARDILSLEGVLAVRNQNARSPKLKSTVMKTLRKALEELDRMKHREGAHLAAEFSGLLSGMEKAVHAIEARVPGEEKRYSRKLRGRICKPANGKEFSTEERDMFLRMVGVFTEKTDIAEELSRLKGHIAQFRHCMDKEDKPGKTLNFIAQEMLREANTIGSKTTSLDIRKSVIRIKTLIEEVKEQSSNVE